MLKGSYTHLIHAPGTVEYTVKALDRRHAKWKPMGQTLDQDAALRQAERIERRGVPARVTARVIKRG